MDLSVLHPALFFRLGVCVFVYVFLTEELLHLLFHYPGSIVKHTQTERDTQTHRHTDTQRDTHTERHTPPKTLCYVLTHVV